MERIINIEDSVIKHCEINRALQYNGYPKAIRAKTVEEGLAMIEEAIDKKTPYELLIVDMHFAVNGIDDWKVGDLVNHDIFGKGVVVKVNKNILDIAFELPAGLKSLMANHKALKKLTN